MKTRLGWAFASAMLLGAIGSAHAADMAVKALPPPVQVFNWTGFYIGGYVGGATADRNVYAGEPATVVGVPFFYNGTGQGTPYSLGNSFIGGGTIGYNWQRPGSNFVLGVEGEAGYLHLSGSRQDVNAALAGLALPDSVDSTRMGDWYGVIAARAGWAANRTLFYVKGGVAFINSAYSFTDTCVGGGCGGNMLVLRHSDTYVTWAAGAGIEYAFTNNWSLKGEYLYLGTQRSYSQTGSSQVGVPVLFANTSSEPGIHTAKIGLNYRWGGPVVAKY